MWLQMIAGIAVRSHQHVNERIAKMRLQIATGAVAGPDLDAGGGVISPGIAPL